MKTSAIDTFWPLMNEIRTVCEAENHRSVWTQCYLNSCLWLVQRTEHGAGGATASAALIVLPRFYLILIFPRLTSAVKYNP